MHTMHKPGSQQLVEEAYLDDLLNPEAGFSHTEAPVLAEATSEITQTRSPDAEMQHVEANRIELKQAEKPSPAPNISFAKTDNILSEETVPFACQLLVVAGLKLAIPLSDYTKVLSWPDELLPPASSHVWSLGQMQYGQHMLDIIDLAGLIFNRPQQNASMDAGRHSYNSLILLQDGKTCLPCDEVSDMVTIEPAGVCWRSADSRRIWLAGTIKQDGYALLDVDGIIKLSGTNPGVR